MVQVPVAPQNGQLPTPNSAQLTTQRAIQPAAQAVHLAAQNEAQAAVLLAALACVQAAEQVVV